MNKSISTLATLAIVTPLAIQGATARDLCTISCNHPKYKEQLLYVTNNPVHKEPLQFSGNKNKAFRFGNLSSAQRVRDDVLEHKTNVAINRV